MTQPLSDFWPGILNLPDLIVLLFLLWSTLNGARRGLIHTLIHLVGRIAVVLGACWLAKLFAPALASSVVTPTMGHAFSYQIAQSPEIAGVLEKLQIPATQAVQTMAESIAFALLSMIFLFVLSAVLSLISHSLHLLTRFPPLGWLNRLAGAAIGLAGGLAAVLLLLWFALLIRPDLFTALGALSPERISHTVLLRSLLDYFPIL